jgi:two-component system nitrate/nitrite response regulator NarL
MSQKRHTEWNDPESVNAVLVASQRLFREALQRILEVPPLTVVGQGPSLDDALTHLPPGTPLHLAIYNFASDAEAERELVNVQASRERHPGMKSIILTDCQEPAVLLKAVRIGVEAFLSRNVSVDVLHRTLELVLLGQYLLPTGLANLLLDPVRAPSTPAFQSDADPPPPALALPDQRRTTALTPRECEILQCITDGRSNKEIARNLNLTEATVKAHVKALLRKTQMTNRTQAAIWAVSRNFNFSGNMPIDVPSPLGPEHQAAFPPMAMPVRKMIDMA